MITSISIENFKSIQSLDMELGRLNVFIGANGSGKSNILEAVAMGSAAMEDKLDDEFLANRGIRITEPSLMKSGFDKKQQKASVRIIWSNEKVTWGLTLTTSNGHYNSWIAKGSLKLEALRWKDKTKKLLEKQLKQGKLVGELEKAVAGEQDPDVKNLLAALRNLVANKSDQITDFNWLEEAMPFLKRHLENSILQESGGSDFLDFLIFAPENHFLRRFEEETQIKPLGIKGEGLFKLLTIISLDEKKQFEEIKTHLRLIDWFEDIEIPNDLRFTERRIKIKDSFLDDSLQYFDQRSANEGFLYLLFYLTLFISKDTPHFFAIDNIDNSLNPKLGSELINILAQLAKDHHKQALLTTHNPVILDGLDLNDDAQRLFVVYRNADGHTKVRRIPPRKAINGIEPVRLSEAFIRGYIGGLPDNF